MNALRPVSLASRSLRIFCTALFAAAILAGLLTSASLAGLKSAPTHGLGAALALIAQVRTMRAQANAAEDGFGNTHAANGRTLINHRMMRSGAILKARATAGTVVPISSPVQTYDVFNPPPAFRPLIGYGDVANLDNNPADKPIYTPDNALTPTNLTPVWSLNEAYLVFSSNRTLTGGVQTDGRFHLWAISINGGEAFQITTSSAQAGENPNIPHGEFFPALNQSNLKIAFSSDSQTPNTRNLYVIGFSFATLSAGGVAPINVSDTTTISSLTLRASTEAGSAALTGFSDVQRPTFSPVDDQLIVFSALSTNGDFNNFNHLYFLYQSSGGFSQGNNISFPGKLTDGPANDTDPTYSPDGQFIAFASTATSIAVRPDGNVLFGPNPPSNPQNPNDSQSFTTVTNNAGGLRSIFLISGGGSGNGVGFGQPQSSDADAPGSTNKTSITTFGTDTYGPAWSNFANRNQYTNPTSNFGYLAFARATAVSAKHDIFYMQAATALATPSGETLTAESDSNTAVLLNSDDQAGEITQSGAAETANSGNTFDDVYPAWSPFLSVFSIVYSSNRTVTYNDPVTANPREVAVSAAQGSTVTGQDALSGYTVAPNYAGLLISQVLNLDPPTILRFSQDEVVHVQAAGPLDGTGSSADPVHGTPNKLAVAGGQKVTLTVRLSNREAGIDDTGGPNGGPRVYIQIKDPDGKYQDARNLEHKVFAKDRQYDNNSVAVPGALPGTFRFFLEPQPNRPINDVTSGTANLLFGNNTGFGYGQNPGLPYQPQIKYFYPSIPSPQGNVPVQYITDLNQLDINLDIAGAPVYTNPAGIIAVGGGMRGAHGGQWAVDATNNPQNTYIFVGKQHGGTNPGLRFGGAAANGFPITSFNGVFSGGFPGGDPRLFVPTGPEYECQAVNPQFAGSGNALAPGDPSPINAPLSVGDYFSPYWLAGVDDQGSFSGGVFTSNTGASGLSTTNPPNGFQQTDRPTANYTATDANNNTVQSPAEWLQLKKVANQDNLGGVLYTATWTTPLTGSDFYVDVIAYDKAAFPNLPSSSYNGKKTNWRIYDNVGGFSTNQSIGNNDILVVSDYALGQKFAATTFGGRNANLNLIPKLFGTESYLTDVDINILPDRVFGGAVKTNAPTPAWDYDPLLQPFGSFSRFGTSSVSFGNDVNATGNALQFNITAQNGLGVGSYIDSTIYDGNTTDGEPNVASQRYSIWRVLARGPVPQTVLNSYLPTPVQQPAINDPSNAAGDAAFKNIPAAKVLDANRCVIWLSPYTGNVLADPGTIDDPGAFSRPNAADRQSTKTILRGFVQGGGRLCVTGQTVAAVLTQGGTVDNAAGGFLPDVLNATMTATSGGTNVLTGAGQRITGNPFYDGTQAGRYMTLTGAFGPNSYFDGFGIVNLSSYPYQDHLVLGDADFNDSALSQVPPLKLPNQANIQQQISTLAPANGAVTDITFANGQAGLVYHDDPYLGGTAGLPTTVTPGVLPNGGTGSRVVFASFGIEALTNDYFSPVSPSNDTDDTNHHPAYDRRTPPVIPRNPRPAIIHNIVNYLRTGRVSGTINQTAGTGQGVIALQGATVYLRPTNGSPSTRAAFSAITDTSGNFTIVGIEPGRYTLVAYKAGFLRGVSNSGVTFTLEGDVTLTGATLTLTPLSPGAIAGAVKDTSGALIDGATVTFTSQDQSITRKIVTVNGSVTGSTTENYLLAGVPPALYTAGATGPLNNQGTAEYTPVTAPDADTNNFDKGVTVQPNTTTQPVNFTLTPIPAKISGRVFDNSAAGGDNATGGALLAGATITVTNPAGTVLGTATAGSDGTYTVTGIAATATLTNDTVTVKAAGYTSAAVTVPLMLGNNITQDIGLAPIPPAQIVTSVSGTILDAQSGAGAAGITVSLTDPNGTIVKTVTTGADGSYSFTQITAAKTAATYTITASATGYVTGTLQVPVKLGDQLTGQNISLNEIATFYGLVQDSHGVPLPGVTISLLDPNGTLVPITPALTSAGTVSAGPDSQSENFSATITPTTALPGTYTIVVAKSGYDAPTTPITFTLTNKTPVRVPTITLTSSVGSLGGIVTDSTTGAALAGATITVTNSSNVTVATLTTNSSAVAGPDGQVLNYQGPVGKGTYTVTLTLGDRTPIKKSVTIVGGQFARVDFTGTSAVQPLHTFTAGLQFLSTPYDYSTLGFDGLFGALGVNRSHVAVWDPTIGAYALDPTPPADTLRIGTGYWVFLKTAVPVTQQGIKPTTALVPVALHPFWNQIGVPNINGVAVANLKFDNGAGGTISFAQAAGTQFHLVSPTLYSFDGTSYQPVDQTGTLQPWKAYWIKVFSNATLEIPTGN